MVAGSLECVPSRPRGLGSNLRKGQAPADYARINSAAGGVKNVSAPWGDPRGPRSTLEIARRDHCARRGAREASRHPCVVLVLFYNSILERHVLFACCCWCFRCHPFPSPFLAMIAPAAPQSSMISVASCREWRASRRRQAPSPSALLRSTRICRRAASRSVRCTRLHPWRMATRRLPSVSSQPCSGGRLRPRVRCCSYHHGVRLPITADRTAMVCKVSASIRRG